MEKPGLQYERTLLSWWRTLLSSIVIVAAICRIGLLSSNALLVVIAVFLLISTMLFSLFTSIELSRNIKGTSASSYGPFIIQKQGLSVVLVFAALFFALNICLRFIPS